MLQFFDTLADISGNALPGAQIVVTAFPGGGAATIYSSNGTANPIPNSTVTADATGQVSFYAPDGAYILTYVYNLLTYKVRSPVQFIDPMGFVAAADAGGSANNYAVSGTAYPAQKYVGLKLEIKAAHTNTSLSTLVYQSDGGFAINQAGGAGLVPGMIQANGLIRVEWDGTQWQLLGSQSQPFYAQTPFEAAVPLVPVSTAFSPDHVGYDVRREGATGNGSTDDRGAIVLAASVGSQLYFPRGTYRIASNMSITTPVLFDSGAIIKPDVGVTVTLSGQVWAGSYKIFDLSNSGALLSLPNQDKLLARWFGVVADGVTDDTNPWLWALNTALGREVMAPVGFSVITAPLSGTTASDIRICGVSNAYLPLSITLSAGASYTDLPTGLVSASEYSLFLCNGCNLIGAPDTGSMNGSTKLRSLRRVIVWANNNSVNSSEGVYMANEATDWTIDECTFVLWGKWGVLGRGGEFGLLQNCAFLDCGWNQAESGAVGPTYYSGAGVRIIANFTAGDYATVVQADQPTVLKISRLWFTVRNDTQLNKSGLRGLQLSGVIDVEISKMGSFVGNYYYLCSGSQTGHHLENYAKNGFTHTDALPRCMALYDCSMEFLPGYETNFGVTTSDPWQINESGTASVAWQTKYARYGVPPVMAGKALSRLPQNATILVVTPGGTDTYTFPNMVQFDANALAPLGFFGHVYAVAQDQANVTIYTMSSALLAAFRAGGSGYQNPAPLNPQTFTTSAGAFSVAMVFAFSNGDLQVKITWGASWAANTVFNLMVGMNGVACTSV